MQTQSQNQKENIVACIRVKPHISSNTQQQYQDGDEKVVHVQNEKTIVLSKLSENYQYEMVFDDDKNNMHIFENLGKQLIDEFLEGKNVCIFAYGQTSSGKTHTMKGTEQEPGLIPQSIAYLFEKIKDQDSFRQIQAKVSYLEIYNELVIDLLNPQPNKSLDIREHPVKGLIVQDLTEQQVSQEKDAIDFFRRGEEKRKFGGTDLNDHSSRSHVIFRVHIDIRDSQKPDKQLYSTLNLIDLAGSENIQRANTDGNRRQEGLNINKSLLALSNVIQKLSLNPTSYINYRDSKLTRLLQPCLGGNSRTAVICTISSLKKNLPETRDTLKFGINAGGIKNEVKVNEKNLVSQEQDSINKTFLSDYLKENTELKTKVQSQEVQITQQEQLISSLNLQLNQRDTYIKEQKKEMLSLRQEIQTFQAELTNQKEIEQRMQKSNEYNNLSHINSNNNNNNNSRSSISNNNNKISSHSKWDF